MHVYINRSTRRDINAYEYDSTSVTVIKEDRMRVRQTPLVYIPSLEKDGALHLIEEIVANALDEVLAPGSVGNEVIITYDEHEKIIECSDNGRGFPLDKLREMCEVLNSSAKMGTDKRAYNQSGGLNGMGLKLCNFLTKWMTIYTEREGKKLELHYVDGLCKEETKTKSKEHGSYISFQYDKRFFTDTNITCEDILKLLQRKAYVSTNGITMIFQGKTKKGKEIVKEFKNQSLKDYMKQYELATGMIEGNGTFGDSNVKYIFGFDTNSVDDYAVISYTNNIYNKFGGSHVEGLLDGIAGVLRDHLYKSYLSEKEKKELKFKAEDFRTGLVGIIALYTLNPTFKGQTKDFLESNEIRSFIIRSIRSTLKSLDNTKLNKLCAIVRANAKSRMAAEISKKRVKKDITNAFSADRIESFIPISKYSTSKFREIYVVEGLSAGGGMHSASDDASQAILALRGKIENVFDLPPEQAVRSSEFLEKLVAIFDCGIGKTFDISKFPYDRVNLAGDADTDGDAISAEIATMIAKFFPQIVTSGRLYRVVPPLYEIKQDGKSIFLSTNRELYEITQRNFAKKHSIYTPNGKMKENEIIELLVRNDRYVDLMNQLANQYAVSPSLCEFIVENMKLGFTPDKIKKWREKLQLRGYRFIKVEESGMFISLTGMIDSEYNCFEYTPEFDYDVSHILKVKDNIYGYSIDSDKADKTLYEILTYFGTFTPVILQRYKGLGQMSSDDLERSLMSRKARHSIQLTMHDINKAYAVLGKMHSKKPEMVKARKDFMANFEFDLIDIDT